MQQKDSWHDHNNDIQSGLLGYYTMQSGGCKMINVLKEWLAYIFRVKECDVQATTKM